MQAIHSTCVVFFQRKQDITGLVVVVKVRTAHVHYGTDLHVDTHRRRVE